MQNLDYNKIAAAILIALLVGLISSIISDEVINPSPLIHPAYIVEGIDAIAHLPSPESKTLTEKPLEPITPLLIGADLNHGKDLLKKCVQCHTFDKDAPNKVGPNQWGVVGEDFAHKQDYAYSDALKSHKGVWDFENLNKFLHKPKDFIPGTKMAFIGIPKAQDRADLIAYLRTLSDTPLPLPNLP